jgi:hypothetical protein
VGYYFSLVDYAFRTGDTSELTSISSRDCAPCQQSIEVVESTYGQGHEYVGGEITVHGAESPTLDPVDAAEVFANYSAEDIEELAPDGAVVNTIAGVDNLRLRFVVTWDAEGGWLVRDLHEVDG